MADQNLVQLPPITPSDDDLLYIVDDPNGTPADGSTTVSDLLATKHHHTVSDITDFPTVPSKTSDLVNDDNFISDLSGLDTDDLSEGTNNKYNVQADWQASSGDAAIKHKPTLGTAAAADTGDFASAAQGALATTALQPNDNVSDLTNDAGYLTTHQDISGKADVAYVNTELGKKADAASLADVATSGEYADLKNTPTFGSAAAADTTDFATAAQGSLADTAVQTETDPTVPAWAKQPSKPSYTKSDVGLGDVTNDAQLKASQLDTDNTLAADSDTKVPSQKAVKAYVDANAGGGGDANVQSDWDESDTNSDAFIQNKPTLGSLAAKNKADIADINATGTTDSSTYLRGDGTWATPSGGGGGGASALDDLTDVDTTGKSDGDVLTYNSTSGDWEAKAPSGGGGGGSGGYEILIVGGGIDSHGVATYGTGSEVVYTSSTTGSYINVSTGTGTGDRGASLKSSNIYGYSVRYPGLTDYVFQFCANFINSGDIISGESFFGVGDVRVGTGASLNWSSKMHAGIYKMAADSGKLARFKNGDSTSSTTSSPVTIENYRSSFIVKTDVNMKLYNDGQILATHTSNIAGELNGEMSACVVCGTDTKQVRIQMYNWSYRQKIGSL